MTARVIVNYLAAVMIFLALTAIFFLGSPAKVNLHDEGLILTGALRITAGEQPAVDFFVSYGPAQFFLLAWVFDLFGASLTASRIYDSALLALVVLCSHRLLRELDLRWGYGTAMVLIVILLLLFRMPLYPLTPLTALVLLGCSATIRALTEEGQGPAGFLPLGAIIAVFTLFRIEFGAIAIAAFGSAMFFVILLRTWAGTAKISRSAALLARAGLIAALAYGCTLGALHLAGFLEPALRDLDLFAKQNYARMRSLPFPGLVPSLVSPLYGLAIYLPMLSFLLGIACGIAQMRTAALAHHRMIRLAVLSSATLFFYSSAVIRTDTAHAMIADIPAVILFVYSIQCLPSAPTGRRLAVGLRTLDGIVVMTAVALVLIPLSRRHFVYDNLASPSTFGTVRGGWISVDQNVEAIADYVAQSTAPSERILSATGRHDKIFIGDAALYFLADRLPGTRWHQYDPGIQTSELVQREMVAELEHFAVATIVVNASWDEVREPNESAISSGVTLLDDYIRENFSPVHKIGPIMVLRRN